jgi:hypothetical protein
VILAALAAVAGQSTQGVTVGAQLVDIDYDGVSGPITFDHDGEMTQPDFSVFEYDPTNFPSLVGRRTAGE